MNFLKQDITEHNVMFKFHVNNNQISPAGGDMIHNRSLFTINEITIY